MIAHSMELFTLPKPHSACTPPTNLQTAIGTPKWKLLIGVSIEQIWCAGHTTVFTSLGYPDLFFKEKVWAFKLVSKECNDYFLPELPRPLRDVRPPTQQMQREASYSF